MAWDRTAASPTQDGPKQYLLCGSCEQHLGEGESLMRRVHYDPPTALDAHGVYLRAREDAILAFSGPKLDVLHRGLLGIAFKILITDPLKPPQKRLAQLQRMRSALLADDYRDVDPPWAFRILVAGAGKENREDRVVWGAVDSAARFTVGMIHWLVPTGTTSSPQRTQGWMLLDHEVKPGDPTKQLWIESEDFDPAATAQRYVQKMRERGSGSAPDSRPSSTSP